MTDHGTPPSIPTEFQQYNSYVEDPKWQTKFSIIWAALVAGAVLYSLPHFTKALWNGVAFIGFWGLREDWDYNGTRKDSTSRRTTKTADLTGGSPSLISRLQGLFLAFRSMVLWSLPGLRLNLGQLIVIVVYLVVVLLCLTTGAQLSSNSNRAGFLALAQLPPLYLFATKNSVLAFLLGPGHSYLTLNPLHRLVGFNILLLSLIHGSLWISNHIIYKLPILSQQKEGSGVAALGCLCMLGISSVQFIREGTLLKLFAQLIRQIDKSGNFLTRIASVCDALSGLAYEWFWVVHLLVSTAFFITLCYHTSFAPPWIFPPLAFLGADLFMRMVRMRMKDAEVWAVNTQMSVIRVPDATSGWVAGQHVRLRVFFGGGRVFESHPLTIMNAPRDTSCLTLPLQEATGLGPEGSGILLGARATGDWTKALNEFVADERERILSERQGLTEGQCCQPGDEDAEEDKPPNSATPLPLPTVFDPWGLSVPTLVSIDGPYGGCSIDLGSYETVLLVAGGSGATFTIGMLDDLVGRVVRGREGGEITKRVEFVWCIRGFGCISWFAPILRSIALAASSTLSSSAPLHLHISIYVTCLCSPEDVLDIPNMDVTMTPRPDVGKILMGLLNNSAASEGTTPMSGLKSAKDGTLTTAADTQPTHVLKSESDSDSDSGSIQETPNSYPLRPRPTTESNSKSSSEDFDKEKEYSRNLVDLEWGHHTILPCTLPGIPLGGGIGVCASGPESLTRETSNAVARLGVTGGGKSLGRVGSVGVHTEVFRI